MASHVYAGDFYDWVERGARRSAEAMVPVIADALRPASVLDVGCGTGIWLQAWARRGCADVLGVDGDYVDRRRLRIARDQFVPHDLTKALDLGRRFDLVQSLEVAEHVPAAFADRFIETLTGHGDLIIFSAAVPGQGGEFHVNEQPYEYWRDKFAAVGYEMYDWVRPKLFDLEAIEPWYRYNVFLFARRGNQHSLPKEIADSRLPMDQPVPNVAPLYWRVRNQTLGLIPQPLISKLSRARYSVANWLARR